MPSSCPPSKRKQVEVTAPVLPTAVLERNVDAPPPPLRDANNRDHWIGTTCGAADGDRRHQQRGHRTSSTLPPPQYLNQKLFDAAAAGNVDIVRHLVLLADNASLNTKETNKDGRPPLIAAARNDHVDVVRLLIDHGAKVNITSDLWETPLLVAVETNNSTLAELLAENGADVNYHHVEGRTPLMVAAGKGHSNLVRWLLERGATRVVNEVSVYGCNALIDAASEGHLEVVRQLLEFGADVAVESGEFALSSAAFHGHVDVVRMLLVNGASPNASNRCGTTPLVYAAERGHVEVTSLLVAHGADVNTQQADGWSAVAIAIKNGHVEIANMLLESGVDMEAALDHRGDRAVIQAAGAGHREAVSFLLAHAGRFPLGEYLLDALVKAACNSHVEVVQLLLENGVDVASVGELGLKAQSTAASGAHGDVAKSLVGMFNQNHNQNHDTFEFHAPSSSFAMAKPPPRPVTTLVQAAEVGDLENVRLLLKEGTDVNARAVYGPTPLSLAAARGHFEVAELLLSYGALVNARSRHTKDTSLMNATAAHAKGDMAQLLIEHGADVNAVNADGDTALIKAAAASCGEHGDTIKLLLEHGADINTPNSKGETPLITAVLSGVSNNKKNIHIIRILVQCGADMNATDREGETALMKAISTRNIEAVEFLTKAGAETHHVATKFGDNALMKAALVSCPESVRLLLENGGADVNAVSPTDGATSLIMAIEPFNDLNTEVTGLLLEHRADVNKSDNVGCTALVAASRFPRRVEVVIAMLVQGVRCHNTPPL